MVEETFTILYWLHVFSSCRRSIAQLPALFAIHVYLCILTWMVCIMLSANEWSYYEIPPENRTASTESSLIHLCIHTFANVGYTTTMFSAIHIKRVFYDVDDDKKAHTTM